MSPVVKLLRIKHWVKNLFLFIPAFFYGNIFSVDGIIPLLQGTLAFSFIASSIYIINDIRDRKIDQLHPTKKERPLASGAITVKKGLYIFLFLTVTGFTISYLVNPYFSLLLLTYFVLNIGYSFGLKNIPIVDLFIVSFGFLFRIHSGGIIANIEVSHWLSIMILLLALFLIFAKRRDDLLIRSETGGVVRKSTSNYNLEFINSCLTLLSAVIIVAYIMYTLSPEITSRLNSDYVYITTIFVIAGVIRYLQITFVEQNSGSPTDVLFKDKFILITIACWVVSFYLIIYVF